jgi:hypothetical protein
MNIVNQDFSLKNYPIAELSEDSCKKFLEVSISQILDKNL